VVEAALESVEVDVAAAMESANEIGELISELIMIAKIK
jgi:hypothetical protein